MKKQILVTVFCMLLINVVHAQTSINPDTVCLGSTEEYKIENPNPNSTYTWGIENGGGTIHTTSNSHTINVEWNNMEGVDELWVYETNKAGCNGEKAKLKVVRVVAPTAKFKEENLCYGDKLHVEFTGIPPFTVEYTLNGNKKIATGIKSTSYELSEEAGEYVLLKVSNSQCLGSLASGGITKAIVAKPLKKLKIIKSN